MKNGVLTLWGYLFVFALCLVAGLLISSAGLAVNELADLCFDTYTCQGIPEMSISPDTNIF